MLDTEKSDGLKLIFIFLCRDCKFSTKTMETFAKSLPIVSDAEREI